MFRFARSILYVLFFISGITGLVYEVTWTRMLTTVFGSTTYAVTTVLITFMGGLALGSYIIGRYYVDKKVNPIFMYGFLEVGISLTAILIPTIYKILNFLYPLIYNYTNESTWILMSAKVILSQITLLIPTFLMGGTLPVISKYFIQTTKESGKQVGLLYSINTIGAAIGCFITGFYLIEQFGITRTINIFAIVNLLIGIISIVLGLGYNKKDTEKEIHIKQNILKGEIDSAKDMIIRPFYLVLILIGFAFAGFVSLSYEILWTRLLVFKLKTTIYAFSIMLTTFLVGISLGSFIVAVIEKYNFIDNHSKAFGIVQSLVGLSGLITIILFSQIDSLLIFDTIGFLKSSNSWTKLIYSEVLLSGMIMIVPTVLMGMTFPIVSRIFLRNINLVGNTVGSIYSVNTIGCIIGSCLTGFVFVKIFGTQNSLILISLIALFFGTSILIFNRWGIGGNRNLFRPTVVFSVVVWFLALLFIIWLPNNTLFNYYNIYEKQSHKDTQIIYANEGIECVTTVHKYPDGYKGISTSSVNVAGTHYTHRTTQKLQAHIPMLIHPNPKKILQIGFGSGETSHLITNYDIEQLDLVDISGEVIETATKYFKDINYDVAKHPKFNKIIMDGANYVYVTNKKYDLVLNDASWPGYIGCSALYSKEYFENAKKLLKPNGIMTSWFPINEENEFKILLKTFHSVFPHVSVWYATTHVNKHALVVGSLHNFNIEVDKFFSRFDQYARKDLESVDLGNPIYFLDTYQMNETVLDAVLNDTIPVHTIDHPILEFIWREIDDVENIGSIKIMVENNNSIIPYLKNSNDSKVKIEKIFRSLEAANIADSLVMRGYINVISSGDYQPKFESEFKEAIKHEPYHPGANHFFFKMFNLHLNLAEKYAKTNDNNYATYCYRLAFNEINFYISKRPYSAKAYHYRGLIYLNGAEYLGLPIDQCLSKAQEDFDRTLILDSQYKLESDI